MISIFSNDISVLYLQPIHPTGTKPHVTRLMPTIFLGFLPCNRKLVFSKNIVRSTKNNLSLNVSGKKQVHEINNMKVGTSNLCIMQHVNAICCSGFSRSLRRTFTPCCRSWWPVHQQQACCTKSCESQAVNDLPL